MKNIQLKHTLLLSGSTGLLLSLAWPTSPLFPLLFVAWVPLLWVKNRYLDAQKSAFSFGLVSLLPMFLWNLLCTWWVWNASKEGAIAMIIANSLLMSIILGMGYFIEKKLNKIRHIAWISTWISFELLHHNWDLAYPWLTLGNGLAMAPALVQWYEYTGILGGSAWILITNAILSDLLLRPTVPKRNFFIALFTPVVLSLFLLFVNKNNQSASLPKNILIYQPNIDPYNEKFAKDPYVLTSELIADIEADVDSSIAFIILPETAIPGSFEIANPQKEAKIQLMHAFSEKHKNTAIIMGLETHHFYPIEENCKKPTLTARKYATDDCLYYDVFNTSGLFSGGALQYYYHKSKLVPGVEKMPFPQYLGFLESKSIDLGGSSGSLGSSPESILFYHPDSCATTGLICYESIFGEFTAKYAAKGANFLTVITNDGWWGNTPGYKQHLHYGALRCIETRKYMARSANTGISALIDDNGFILKRTKWWQKEVIKGQIIPNKKTTFYMKHGDLIGQIARFVSIFLFLGALVSQLQRQRIKPKN
jgi:apolipoprotein N-acyltransferase